MGIYPISYNNVFYSYTLDRGDGLANEGSWPEKYFYIGQLQLLCCVGPMAPKAAGAVFLYLGHYKIAIFYGQLMASWYGQKHIGRDFQNHTF